MKLKTLRSEINSLVSIVEFTYKGIDGHVDPINDHTFYVTYDGKSKTMENIDQVMSEPYFNGKSLNEIVEDLIF